MPRIILATWHGGRPPGAELEVDDAQLAALRRDGRVAAVVQDPPTPAPAPVPAAAPEPEPVHEALPEPGAGDGPSRTRRRR